MVLFIVIKIQNFYYSIFWMEIINIVEPKCEELL